MDAADARLLNRNPGAYTISSLWKANCADCLRMLRCRPQIRVHKVIALVEDGLPFLACQCVAEAIAEVEVGGMAAAFAVVAVGLAGDTHLFTGYWLDGHSGVFNNLFKSRAKFWNSIPVRNDKCLEQCSG